MSEVTVTAMATGEYGVRVREGDRAVRRDRTFVSYFFVVRNP